MAKTIKPTQPTQKPIERLNSAVCNQAISRAASTVFDKAAGTSKHDQMLAVIRRLFEKNVPLLDICVSTGANIFTVLNEVYSPEVADQLSREMPDEVKECLKYNHSQRNSLKVAKGIHSND